MFDKNAFHIHFITFIKSKILNPAWFYL